MPNDARIAKLAETLVAKCLELKEGARVVINVTGPEGMGLAEACVGLIARRGGQAFVRTNYQSINRTFLNEAPDHLLDETPEADLAVVRWATARISIDAPELEEDLPPQPDPARQARRTRVMGPIQQAMRQIAGPLCNVPTPELARRAGMSLEEYADFLFAACDYDWAEMEERLNSAMARFAGGDAVRILAPGTDLSFRIKDVPRFVSVGKGNMPSGEIYFSPIPDSTVGRVSYDWPCTWQGKQVRGVSLVFREGKVVEATAEEGQDFLLATLDTDEGACRLGEFGVGLNPYIQRYTNNILFDEKIGGTIHLALGQAYGEGNRSLIHWDMVKDMRPASEIYLDGKLIYRDGRFI